MAQAVKNPPATAGDTGDMSSIPELGRSPEGGHGCCCCCKSLQSCLTLCDPMDCSLPGSSAHGIFQARVLEWEGMATHSNIPAWRIPWREEPGGLPSMGSQRVGHDLATITPLKNLPAMRETWVQSLGQEDPLETEMATHSSILAGRIRRRSLVGYSPRGRKELDSTE